MDGHATKWGVFNAHFWGAFTGRSDPSPQNSAQQGQPHAPQPECTKPRMDPSTTILRRSTRECSPNQLATAATQMSSYKNTATKQIDAEQETRTEVKDAARKQDAAFSLVQTVSIVQRCASDRARGRNFAHLAEQIPPSLVLYIMSLGTSECEILAKTDVRVVSDFIASNGTRAIPGIRSKADLEAEELNKRGAPSANPIRSPSNQAPVEPELSEQAILSKLSERLVARGRTRAPSTAEAVLSATR